MNTSDPQVIRAIVDEVRSCIKRYDRPRTAVKTLEKGKEDPFKYLRHLIEYLDRSSEDEH